MKAAIAASYSLCDMISNPLARQTVSVDGQG
jgi:hypothetical protein